MKIIDEIKASLWKIPLCNKKAERAPHIGGKCFILCWRCTMVMIFTIISTLAVYYMDTAIFRAAKFTIIGSTLLLPMIIDGSIQYFKIIDSTNFRRAITGALFGVGISLLLA